MPRRPLLLTAMIPTAIPVWATEPQGAAYGVRFGITSKPPCAKVPLHPRVAFASLIGKSGAGGVMEHDLTHVYTKRFFHTF